MEEKPLSTTKSVETLEPDLDWFDIQQHDTSGFRQPRESLQDYSSQFDDFVGLLRRATRDLDRTLATFEIFSMPTDQQIRYRWIQISQQFPRIQVCPGVVNDEPCIAGTRIPVSIILSSLAEGDSPQEIVKGFGNLSLKDIKEALLFAARLTWLD